MEHWFDNLSRPHSRRTTLKAAVVAGVALIVPGVRTSRAWATQNEPCYKACVVAAANQWIDEDALCFGAFTGTAFVNALLASTGIGLLGLLGTGFNFRKCVSLAELAWRRRTLACRGSECGDTEKYPGGKAPKRKCDPDQEVPCGDDCCNSFKVCCHCKNGGNYICCIDAEHCEPDPQGNRGSCCT